MRLVAQVRIAFSQHQRRIRISGAHPQVSHSLIPGDGHAAILRSQLLKPVMALFIVMGEFLTLFLHERGRKWHRNWLLLLLNRITESCILLAQRLLWLCCCFLS